MSLRLRLCRGHQSSNVGLGVDSATEDFGVIGRQFARSTLRPGLGPKVTFGTPRAIKYVSGAACSAIRSIQPRPGAQSWEIIGRSADITSQDFDLVGVPKGIRTPVTAVKGPKGAFLYSASTVSIPQKTRLLGSDWGPPVRLNSTGYRYRVGPKLDQGGPPRTAMYQAWESGRRIGARISAQALPGLSRAYRRPQTPPRSGATIR